MNHWLFGQTTGTFEVEEVIGTARASATSLAQVTARRRIAILARAARAWADPDYSLRLEAEAALPELLNLSSEMVSRSLSMIAEALSEACLETRVVAEIGSLDLLDGWGHRPGTHFFWRARPLGVVLAVAPGNVFVGSAVTIAECLLAGNATILKAPSGDPLFARLFAQSLTEADLDGRLAGALAVVAWKGGDDSVESRFKQGCDGVVITGGEEAVGRYRQDLPATTALIDYGPKLSFAAITRDAPGWQDPPELAKRLAQDVVLWDQMACSAPQMLYLEGEEHLDSFLPLLAEQLASLGQEIPPGVPALPAAVEITKERELARFEQSQDLARVWHSDTYTLVYERRGSFRPSPLYRTLLIRSLDRLEDLDLEGTGSYLQTVGLEASPGRACELATWLTDQGATRVVPLGQMAGGSPGEPHDGRLGLEALIKWVTLEAPGVTDPWEAVASQSAHSRQQEQAVALAAWAKRHSPFFARLYQGCDPEGWERLPTMGREDVRQHTPPHGYDLLTGPLERGTVLRSGGTSGEPRYSIFSRDDYEADVEAGIRLTRGCGLQPGDRCANLFLSGDLYGSFLSIHRILEGCPVVNFPFTSGASLESVVATIKKFDLNVLLGVSSFLVRFFRQLDQLGFEGTFERVIYGGEPYPAADRRWAGERFGISSFRSIVGANDGGPIGFQCDRCQDSVHHLTSQHILLEILDPESLRPVARGQAGEMVITCLHRRLMPLIRYRVGDLGRILPGPCDCGRTSPRFELLGRADDILCIGSTNTTWTDVCRALDGVEGLTGSIQLVGEGETIVVRVEGQGDPGAARSQLLERIPVLKERLQQGLLDDVRVDLVPMGTLETNPRSGKLVRVIDRRSGGRG